MDRDTEMQTTVLSTSYDREKKTGVVRMQPRACTDMSGAIRYFLRIDPDVRIIRTIAGDELDTVYVRRGARTWTAWTKQYGEWRYQTSTGWAK